MCFTLYRTSRKLGRDSRIRSKQKFITKALRGGRLLTLSSETTRSPGCIREILQKKLAKEGRHSREKKKANNQRMPETKLDYFATKNSSRFASPRETRRRNNHRESRSRPRNDFSSTCNGNIKAA